MEKKDIQIVPIKSSLISPELRKEYEDMGYDLKSAFLLPYRFEPRFRVIVETLKEFADNSDGGEMFDICQELDYELKQICRSLLYLIHSVSYRKGQKYYDFDKMEIDSKLRRNK